ncbi:MAG: vWA domain-containing protein [Polyangiaceae bacterium]
MRTIQWLVSAGAAVCGIVTTASCAENAGPEPPEPATGGSATSLAGNGGSGGATSAGGGGLGGTGPEICVLTSKKAEPVPLDLILLIDRSGSMAGTKWTGTTEALTEFINDPASAGISAGLVFFPSLQVPSATCEVTSYKIPDVPIAPLPGNAFNLTNKIPAKPTGSGTPTLAALTGVLQLATAYQDAHPTHKVNVVLATDGDPCCCSDDSVNQMIKDLEDTAESALKYNGVHTFVIGVQGATMANLDDIAEAGGTVAAHDVTDDIEEFALTMNQIRAAALGCEFAIPLPPSGDEVVPDQVNFTYTPGGAGEPITLPRADNLVDCGAGPGWYYDNNAAPQKIILCPESCTTVQNDEEAAVAAAFGCQSVLN